MRIDGRTRWLLAVFLLATLLRLVEFERSGLRSNPLSSEPSEEVYVAQAIAAGHGFVTPVRPSNEYVDDPSAYCAPGYPYFLAGLIRIARAVAPGGTSLPYSVAIFINIAAGAAAVALLACAVGTATGTHGFWCAAVLASAWPTLIRGSVRLWDTAFTLLGIAFAVWLGATSTRPPPSLRTCLVWGLACGALTLTNPILAPVLCVAILARLGVSFKTKGVVRSLGVLGVAWLLCLAPWMIRNAVVFQRVVPIRNTFGFTLWVGNLPDGDGTVDTVYAHSPFGNREEGNRLLAMGEDRYMQMRSRDAIAILREDPQLFLRRTGWRVALYWLGNWQKPTRLFGLMFPMPFEVNLAKPLLNLLLILAAAAGSFFWTPWRGRLVCWMAIAFLPLPFYVTHVSPHYRVYVDPVLVALAAGSVDGVVRSGRGWGRPAGSGSSRA
jgi:hypothetical protein